MTIILTIIKAETIYIVDQEVFDTFEGLLIEHPHIVPLISDLKHGYVFQTRLIFDLYYFLTTPADKILVDPYKTFERPINTFLHEIFCKQQQLHTFKLTNQRRHLHCLLVSLFVTKKITPLLYTHAKKLTEQHTFENLLELYNPADHSIHPEEQQLIIQLQANLLKAIKQADISYKQFIKEALEEARELYNFMTEVR